MTASTATSARQTHTSAPDAPFMRHQLRSLLATCTRRLPTFRGLGRLILAADRWLTDSTNPASFEALAVVNGGGRFLLDLRTWEQKFAFYYGTYEPEFLRATARLFDGGIFYDIGASIGLYTVPMALRCQQQGGHVRAFEPVPQNLQRLHAQLQANQLNEDIVRIETVALSDQPGTALMDLCDDGKPGNAKITGSGHVEVPVVTLDHIWNKQAREQIRFIKIDTEGWDANILAGGHEAISTCLPNMLIEFNRERMTNHGIALEPAWKFLVSELGYRVFRLDENGRPVEIEEPGEYENLFFVQPQQVSRLTSV